MCVCVCVRSICRCCEESEGQACVTRRLPTQSRLLWLCIGRLIAGFAKSSHFRLLSLLRWSSLTPSPSYCLCCCGCCCCGPSSYTLSGAANLWPDAQHDNSFVCLSVLGRSCAQRLLSLCVRAYIFPSI